jgi:hypothetical protein
MSWLVLLTYLAFAYTPWRTALTRLSKRLGDWMVGLLLHAAARAFQRNSRPLREAKIPRYRKAV